IFERMLPALVLQVPVLSALTGCLRQSIMSPLPLFGVSGLGRHGGLVLVRTLQKRLRGPSGKDQGNREQQPSRECRCALLPEGRMELPHALAPWRARDCQ